MCAQLALPPYQAYPGGSGMGYLEFCWSSAGDTGHVPVSAGPAAAASASPSPEAGQHRQTTGKMLLSGYLWPHFSHLRNHCEQIFFFFLLAFDFLYVSWAKIHVAGEKDGLWLSLHLYTVRFSGACELVS